MDNEEKISPKTRIKEWIIVLGILIIVGVASFLAFQYGFNKTNKSNEQNDTNENVSNENITEELDITSKKYGNNTENLPEYLVSEYLNSYFVKNQLGINIENNVENVYDDNIKTLFSFYKTLIREIVDCKDIYKDSEAETEITGSNEYEPYEFYYSETGNYIVYKEPIIARCISTYEVYTADYETMVENSITNFGYNAIMKDTYFDNCFILDYNEIADKYIMLYNEKSNTTVIICNDSKLNNKFNVKTSEVSDNQLKIVVNYIINDEIKSEYLLIFDINDDNTLMFNSFNAIKC